MQSATKVCEENEVATNLWNNCMKYSRGAFAFKLILKNVLALVMILFDIETLQKEPKLK